jgi:hypothetical protein
VNYDGSWRGERATLDQEIFQARELLRADGEAESTITSGQFNERAQYRNPIQRLGIALIESAVRDAQRAKFRATVAQWIKRRDNSPCSLPWVADLLGLDPERVRRHFRGKLR